MNEEVGSKLAMEQFALFLQSARERYPDEQSISELSKLAFKQMQEEMPARQFSLCKAHIEMLALVEPDH